ncbi:MAG: hypothetical protein E7159_02235 [Firmicutes bacterium]|nr:hypothetical protein [Bacillota bacterium]
MSDEYLKNKKNYERLEKSVSEDIKKYEELLNNESNEFKKRIYKGTIIRRKNYLKDIKNILNNLREPMIEDIEYRKNIMENYASDIEKYVPEDLHLCFHGCPIYTAKEIIETKSLSSSVDRIGTETSYDTTDQVSVTTKDTIITTLDGYSDIHSLNYTIPCGVVFVINPKDESEIQSSKGMIIANVDLNDKNRLYAILSTPENMDKLKDWCNNSNLDSNLVKTFDQFINQFKNINIK